MQKNCFLSVFLFLFAHCCYADYIGAVVEYNPLSSSTPTRTIEENINGYIYQIKQASTFGAKIIVFPEYGLTGLVPSPEGYGLEVPNVGTSDFSNPSLELLLRLSNAALEYQLYVVVNILEQTNSTNNQTLYYNSNLVFASNGTLVAKYRKINLFQEPKLTAGRDLVTFTTDFGTFGLMTCADILYNNPSQTLLANSSVTDVIYPSAWTSYLPFYMSLEVQVGYALANKVNLLASNINNPSNGLGGSGIFSSDGTVLRRILTDKPATAIVYASIAPPSSATNSFALMGFDVLNNNTQELVNYKNLTDFQSNLYVYKPLDLSKENITEEICHEKFCCTFNIVATKNDTNSSEVYKLLAYNGNALFDTQQVRVKHCNLVACLNQDTSSCGVRPATSYTTRFSRILVWSNSDNKPEQFYRPASLRGNLEPIYNVTYLESKTNESVGISFNITQPTTNVVLFGLYGRGGVSGVEALSVSLILVAVIVAMQGIF